MSELHRRRGVPALAAVLKWQDWGVLKTGFGKTYAGGMRAEFAQLPSPCNFTVGPELRRLQLKATRSSWPHSPQRSLRKPCAGMPHSR